MEPFTLFWTQEDAFNVAHSREDQFFFAVDKSKDGKKKYGSYSSLEAFLIIYNALPNDKKHFYELLPSNSLRFEFYDIDEKESNIEPEKILAKFFSTRMKFLKYQFDLDADKYKDDWRITDSSRQNENGTWKVSFHLINRALIWTNLKESQLWCKLFDSFNKSHSFIPNLFDTAVYTKNRCMRIIGSSKFGQERPLLAHESCLKYPIEDFFITTTQVMGKMNHCISLYGFEEKEKEYEAENKKLITFANSFKETILVNEEEDDETEKLVELIATSIRGGNHSLCDEGKPQMKYENFRNLCFAFCHAAREDERTDNELFQFMESEIYPFYRNGKDYEPRNILDCIIKGTLNRNVNVYTKKSLHYWARENEQYSEFFQVKKYIGIRQFDTYDLYDWLNFKDEMETQVFNSYEDARKCFLLNFNRVCVPICLGEDTFYIKQTDQMNDFNFVQTKTIKFNVRFMGISKKKIKQEETINFKKLYEDCIDNIQRFKNFGFCPFSVLHPNESLKEGIFNQFSGFKAKYKGQTDNIEKVQFLLDFLKLVWCDNKDDLFEYLLSWLAHIVQKPQQKTRVMLVLYSKEFQIGKGLFLEWFIKNVIGLRHGIKSNSFDHVAGRFNSAIENKIVFGLDEIAGETMIGFNEIQKLKSLITDDIQQVEKKGVDPHTHLNCLNIVACTNHEIPMENKDARIQVFECNPFYQGKTKELDKIRKKLNEPEMNDEFFTFLMNYKILIDLRNIINTATKEEMIMTTCDQPTRFFKEIENDTFEFEIIKDKLIEKEEDVFLQCPDLFEIFEKWSVMRREKQGIYSISKFGRIAKKFINCKTIRIGDKISVAYNITKYKDKIKPLDIQSRPPSYY